eukprot:GHVU01211458.1.p1 GENE.GHVU01211458.1~~GHVU01211458.1.p1  ORF type:complete len:187 (+),score=21.03 GHVU01211458.1:1133-1693(+)
MQVAVGDAPGMRYSRQAQPCNFRCARQQPHLVGLVTAGAAPASGGGIGIADSGGLTTATASPTAGYNSSSSPAGATGAAAPNLIFIGDRRNGPLLAVEATAAAQAGQTSPVSSGSSSRMMMMNANYNFHLHQMPHTLPARHQTGPGSFGFSSKANPRFGPVSDGGGYFICLSVGMCGLLLYVVSMI